MLKEKKVLNFYKRANLLALGVAVSLLSACGGGSSNNNNDDDDEVAAANITIVSSLSGNQRVPAIDTTASGISSLTLNPNTGELTGSVTASNLSGPITVAHLHLGFAGIEGPVVIGFEQSVENDNVYNIPAESILTADQMSAFLIAQTYVNVHTAANPSGEIRGQVLPENFRVIRSDLEGAQENPPVSSAGSATAYATINDSDLSIVANVRSININDATMAHIHSGFAGLNGAVLLGLEQDVADVALWTTPENSILTEEQLAQLNAGGAYYNLHTPANPSGELRGQIIPEGVSLLRTELQGQQQNPPVVSAGSALAYSTINTETGAIVANLRSTNLEDATVAHIHNGFAGTNGPVFLGLEQNADDPSLWASPSDATLSAEALGFINAGSSYYNLHTPANPSGEVRGQIIPQGVVLARTELEGAQQNPPVVSAGSAIAYATVNTTSGSVVANVTSTNLDDATVLHIHTAEVGVNGPVAVGLEQSASDVTMWSTAADSSFTEEQLTLFLNGGTYFNLHTPANPSGEVRGQNILNIHSMIQAASSSISNTNDSTAESDEPESIPEMITPSYSY